MDIALLKEQYNSIKDKQKRETRVICFKTASNNEEISGKSLINVVPLRQAKPSHVRQASLQETKFDFVKDPASAPWRTHLGMYRRTRAAIDANRFKPKPKPKPKTSTGDSVSPTSEGDEEGTDSSNQLSDDSEELNTNNHVTGEDRNDFGSRKYSEPTVSVWQGSCGSRRYSHSPVSLHYYPFPQLKSPRKSEAARRLGLYSSF